MVRCFVFFLCEVDADSKFPRGFSVVCDILGGFLQFIRNKGTEVVKIGQYCGVGAAVMRLLCSHS